MTACLRDNVLFYSDVLNIDVPVAALGFLKTLVVDNPDLEDREPGALSRSRC